MHTLVRSAGLRSAFRNEAPSLIASMVIAELLYKFHSFTLECVAFLATWYAVSFVADLARARFTSVR